ncbi:protein transport protein Sec31A isoform X8 [Anguilla anguilla]|uniref:protein transport protein Sec31A isoform X8 n=1 Tax=Anguilla anguilla TaxID=7936 RepID=UPI0015AED5E3|nr:protein transport protein Sec31A isoform X8 [Anguilla anguilla]
MKLKEINRTAIQAWSPAQQHPVYLAAGTSAQQLDATFSTSASLEIFELDLAEPTLSMKSCGTFSSSHRYHKLVWGPHGMDSQGHPSGVLIAGGENGSLILYDPAKIIAGDSDVIISQNDKHTGPVRALDVNPFQTNLVASGGNESEIYIWDLNNISSPMTPGPKTQPLEDISCVAWNRQVQHILASASPSGRASVWDLRKNDLIIKVSDHSNRMHCSGLAWNPEVATQLVLASEDDRMPVIQMWDLRFATSPLKVLENHTRGILAIAWSLADPELLLSCGKDNRILCWNPNTGEVLYELPTSTQWCFDIQWCPRNPAVLSAAAFDGHISIYSIMGGSNQNQIQQPVDQISASFGNMDPFGMGQALPPLQLPQSSAPQTTITPLKKPPKWIRRPVGASFAFGGKLVSLENVKPTPQQPQQPTLHIVHVSQVVTETDFLDRSSKLQATMTAGNFVDFCQSKIEAAQSEFERTLWSFLKVNFEDDTRGKYLELLGYKKEELALKIEAALQKEDITPEEPVSAPDAEPQPVPVLEPQPALQPISEPQPALDLQSGPELELKVDPIPEPQVDVEPEPQLDLKPPVDLTSEPQLDLEPEVEPEVEPEIDLGSEEITNAEPALQEEEVNLNEMEEKEADEGEVCVEATDAINLKVTEGVDGLITEALLTGDFESAVELCLHDNRMADSIILAIAGGPELLEKTQKKYFEKTSSRITKLISAVVTNDWRDILETCDLQNWKEALAAVLTYASPEEFSALCDLLGSRLEADADLQPQACLCYVCAGNVEKLVACWARAQESHSPLSLQDLVEKVVVLRKAVEQTQGASPVVVGTLLAEKMSQYAGLLASQGSLLTAMAYLPENSDQVAIQLLRARLRRALGEETATPALPAAPGPAQPAPPSQPAQPSAPVAAPAVQAYAPVQPPHTPHPPQPTHVPTAPPQYYQQVRSASTITSWSNQTPTALPSIPAPVGPASDPQPPVQAEPAPPGFVLQPQAAPPVPASSGAGYPYPQQYPHPYPQIQHYVPGAGGPAIYQPHQYTAAAHPHLPPSSSSPVAAYPPYMHPPTSHPPHPVFPSPGVSGGPSPLAHHPPPPTSSFSPPTSSFSPPPLSSGASFQHSGPGAPASYLPPPPTGPTGTEPEPNLVPASQRTGGMNGQDTAGFMEGPQNGWNDPPALSRVAKKKKVPENYTPPAPITAPIMAPLGDPQAQAQVQAPPTLQPQQLPTGQPGVQAPYPGLQQPLVPPPRQPTMPKANVEGAPGAPIGDIIQPVQAMPAEKITKKPIPEEHLVLKTTFEGLIQKCLAAATDPQTKRKLDDANKRLELLYDKLREKTLSPAIVGGLHSMARSIEARSYTDSLNIHTHIVSNSNFSETSAFMPVLKVVLTQANKLGV